MPSDRYIAIFALALLSIMVIQQGIVHAEAGARLRVAVTAPVLEPLVRAIGGDRVDVASIIPPGVDPHTYEPPARFAGELDSFDVIVMTGPHHLKVEEVILQWKRQGMLEHPVIVYYGNYTGNGLRLMAYGSHSNPHGYWWGPRSLAVIARSVGEALAAADPAGARYYDARAELYAELAEALAGRLDGLSVAAYSPAVQYFVEESGGSLVYTASLSPDSEPSADAARVIEDLYSNGTIDVFVVTWVDEALSKAASSLADTLREAGVPVAEIPLGMPGADPLETIAAAQGAILEAASGGGSGAGGPPSGGPGGLLSWWSAGLSGFMAGLVVAVAWVRASRG